MARDLLALAALVAVVFGLHARALKYDLFMDDHAHFRQLQECDWSIGGLASACRLELVGEIAEVWWLNELTLRFFRPVSFGLMKLTYTLTDWSPRAMHAASLLWHTATCVLLMFFLRRLGARPSLSWIVAAIFAVHPGHVATVQWIACQSELMVTTFLLAATLCYARFRGWAQAGDASPPERPPNVGWAALAAFFFALALGCRENAVVFPVVILALEKLFRRENRRRGWLLIGLFAVMAVAYVGIRTYYLGGAAIPPRPYIVPPTAPDFPRYVFDKACYYLLGEFFAVPCIPIGGLPYFRERPLVFYGLSAVAVAIFLAVTLRFLRRRPGPIGPAWLLGFMAPVLPSFASPHHLYLPGIGWAVMAMLILRGIGKAAPSANRRSKLWRAGFGWACAIALGALFGVATHFFGLSLETAHRVEAQITDEVIAAPSGLEDGDTIYFVHQPIIAHYLRLDVERRAGLRDIRVVPLTWAPRVLNLATPSEITWIDDRTFDIHIRGDRFFGGTFGRLAAEATGRPNPVERGAPVETPDFGVELLERDEQGIMGLRFTFKQTLARPDAHLFWGSHMRWATEIEPPKPKP